MPFTHSTLDREVPIVDRALCIFSSCVKVAGVRDEWHCPTFFFFFFFSKD